MKTAIICFTKLTHLWLQKVIQMLELLKALGAVCRTARVCAVVLMGSTGKLQLGLLHLLDRVIGTGKGPFALLMAPIHAKGPRFYNQAGAWVAVGAVQASSQGANSSLLGLVLCCPAGGGQAKCPGCRTSAHGEQHCVWVCLVQSSIDPVFRRSGAAAIQRNKSHTHK